MLNNKHFLQQFQEYYQSQEQLDQMNYIVENNKMPLCLSYVYKYYVIIFVYPKATVKSNSQSGVIIALILALLLVNCTGTNEHDTSAPIV